MKTETQILFQAEICYKKESLNTALQTIFLAMTEYQAPKPDTWGFTVGMPRLDAFCLKLGKEFLAPLPNGDLRLAKTPLDVYLASDIYPIGGHTGLIGDYVGNSSPRSAHLLVTNLDNRPVAMIKEALWRTRIPEEETEICPANSLGEKALWLLRRILELQADRLYLFGHPQDPAPIFAAQPGLARETIYVHHADHTPALGLYLRHARHLDLTPRAYHCCKHLLGIAKNCYLPLQCVEAEERALPVSARSLKHTASCGSANKFSFVGPLAYPDIITRLLVETKVCHFHIGPLSDKVLEEWRLRLRELNIAEDRLVHLPKVASVWQALREYQIDLYLHSFPTPGARTAVEVMGAGMPILYYSKLEKGLRTTVNLVYPEAVSWSTPEELIVCVQKAGEEWLDSQRRAARRYYEKFHSPSTIAPLFRENRLGTPPALPIDPEILDLYRESISHHRKAVNNTSRWLRIKYFFT